MKQLIVNADDFGLTPGVSEGIVHCHRQGIVTSTTLLVNLPAATAAVALLPTVPGLGVGLHLNLTTGEPVLPAARVPSLLGRRRRFRKDPIRLRLARPEEVLAEWAAQLARFRALVGRDPTHIDSHHHIHLVPWLTAVALELARREGIPALRVIGPADVAPPTRTVQRLGRWVARRLLRGAAALVDDAGLRHPDHARVLTARHGVDDVLTWIAELPAGSTELVCHPGFVDSTLRHYSGKLGHRADEVRLLCDPALRQALAAAGVQLASYAALAQPLPPPPHTMA